MGTFSRATGFPSAQLSAASLVGALLLTACGGNETAPDAGAAAGRTEPGVTTASLPPAPSPDPSSPPDGVAAAPPSAPPDATSPPGSATPPSPPQSAATSRTVVSSDAPREPGLEPLPLMEALVYVTPQVVRQGGVFLLAVDAPQATAASVAYRGEFFSLLREGDRFFTLLPVDALMEPGTLPLTIALADADGRTALQMTANVTVEEVLWPTEVIEIDEAHQRLLDPDVIAEDRAVRQEVERAKSAQRHWRGFFRPPTDGFISSLFGTVRSYRPIVGKDYHTGLDFGGPLGTEIVAPNGGIVAWTGETERRGRGLILDHGGGVLTSYWHLSSVSIQPGVTVRRGDPLGRVGSSGFATGPHLHWEVLVHGVPVDPLPWLRELEVPDPSATFAIADAINAPPAPAGPDALRPTR